MGRFYRFILYVPVVFALASVAIVLLFKYVPLTCTPLMVVRKIQFCGDSAYQKRQVWIPLSGVSKEAVDAIILSEDAGFWHHKGVDVGELRRMYAAYKRGDKGLRGCSTISQQVAKNCFTFSTETCLRKVVELYWTGLIELIWGKERILEVYLNVAEMGYGIYGIEAAAQKYFHCTAKELSLFDGAALAVCMPQPLLSNPVYAWDEKPLKIRYLAMQLKGKGGKL